MKAVVIIHDARAYRIGLLQGEVGFGLAYMKGYWSSPDPVALVRLVVRGMTSLTEDRGLFSWLGKRSIDYAISLRTITCRVLDLILLTTTT